MLKMYSNNNRLAVSWNTTTHLCAVTRRPMLAICNALVDASVSSTSYLMADNINLFKNHLNKFWSSCEFVYSYRAQPFGTGNVK